MSRSVSKSVLVKICGVTNSDDAVWATNLGVDFIGINMYSESSRKVSLEKAIDIISSLPSFVKTVGVFVDPELGLLEKILKKVKFHYLQLHGNEPRELVEQIKNQFQLPIWKAIHMENAESVQKIEQYQGLVHAVLLDAYHPEQWGGAGTTFDWSYVSAAKAFGIPIVLSGGLNSENVQSAIHQTEPYGVDVASSVEKKDHPRKKDIDKMKAFLFKAKSV